MSEALAGRRLWADVIEANDACIEVVDPDLCFLAINAAGAREWGRIYRKTASVGDRLGQLLEARPGALSRMQTMWRRALAGESFLDTELSVSASGEQFWREMKFSPLFSADGHLIGACRISYDVTERVRQQEALDQAQKQLFESQKMETVGHLTGGIAHDFNNLLSAIIANLELATKRVSETRTLKLLDGAMQGAQRGASLTKRLLAFARRQDLRAETVNVHDLVEGMRELLARSLGPGVRIASDFPANLPPVLVDPNQLELALLNLAVNARDAMPLGGTLSISASSETFEAKPPLSNLAPGAYVRIDVADTGQGMDADTLRRATEPFFTTKGIGKGTGLGLSMVHGLAAQSGGGITIVSEAGRGTTVRLWLPCSETEVRNEHAVAAPPLQLSRSLTILVVDDDALVAMGTTAMLEDLGHSVIEAHGGRRALELVESQPDIDLVITDYAMPGMSGVELAKRLQSHRSDLLVVLATGYSELPNGEDTGLPRISKPFGQHELAAMIDTVMRSHPDAPNILPSSVEGKAARNNRQ